MQPSVSFPGGATYAQTKISSIVQDSKQMRTYVVFEDSCFHPRDFRWPDQPADRGFVEIETVAEGVHRLDVLDAGKLLVAPGLESLFDTAICYTKQDMPSGARLLCALAFSSKDFNLFEIALAQGQSVALHVDSAYRNAISTGHSLGHLASYALNEVFSRFWRKEVPVDDRGFPDFIRLSQVDSKVYEFGTQDTYRVGKSFRKLGFNSAEALSVLPELRLRAHELLLRWLELGPHVEMVCDGLALDDSRRWKCRLAEKEFSMFCGGTHLFHFRELDLNKLSLMLEYSIDSQSIVMDIRAL